MHIRHGRRTSGSRPFRCTWTIETSTIARCGPDSSSCVSMGFSETASLVMDTGGLGEGKAVQFAPGTLITLDADSQRPRTIEVACFRIKYDARKRALTSVQALVHIPLQTGTQWHSIALEYLVADPTTVVTGVEARKQFDPSTIQSLFRLEQDPSHIKPSDLRTKIFGRQVSILAQTLLMYVVRSLHLRWNLANSRSSLVLSVQATSSCLTCIRFQKPRTRKRSVPAPRAKAPRGADS